MNTAESANNLYSFIKDKTFQIEDFQVHPGGFNCFNSFFSRYIKPGKRPIGTKTHPYIPPSSGNPVPSTPDIDKEKIHQNMADDKVITVPADSVFKGAWKISEENTITVSKGNTYSIDDLLKGSKYKDAFKGGMFTHSYLTVFTYHRYHVPVRGTVLETDIVSERVFANVEVDKNNNLGAADGTGYQFKQDRGILVMDSPIGKVALVPIGMDFISSCNFSVDEEDYLNKGDEFGYFLFGGSDMIMLFDRDDINVALPEKDMFYKLGQVFGTI
jgi:phosphatidylserine decarboxylase